MADGGEKHADSDAKTVSAAIERVERMQTYLKHIEKRASEYQAQDDRRGYFFLIQGMTAKHPPAVDASIPRQAFTDSAAGSSFPIQVTEVDNFPSESHFAGALSAPSRRYYGLGIGRAEYARHELYIGQGLADQPQHAMSVAHRVLYLLRARSASFFTVPMVSSMSWNQLAAVSDSADVYPLGDEWASKPLFESQAVSGADLEWAIERSPRAFDLYEMPSFRLAFDALNRVPFETNERTAIATAWAGIEAILGIDQELSYRIGMYLAVVLEDDPALRPGVRERIKRLYGKRSRAVHGASMTERQVSESAFDSWKVLRDLVVRLVDTDLELPTAARIDEVLLSGGRFCD